MRRLLLSLVFSGFLWGQVSSYPVPSGGGGGGSTSPGGSNTQVQFNDSSAFGGNSGLTFNKTSLTTPSAPTITCVGAGCSGASTPYGYKVRRRNGVGKTLFSAEGTTAVGPASLSASTFLRVTLPNVAGECYDVYKSTAPVSLNVGQLTTCVTGASWDDIGGPIVGLWQDSSFSQSNTTIGASATNLGFNALQGRGMGYDPVGYFGSPLMQLNGTQASDEFGSGADSLYPMFVAQGGVSDPSSGNYGFEESGFISRAEHAQLRMLTLGSAYADSDPINTKNSSIIDAIGENGVFLIGQTGPVRIVGPGGTFVQERLRVIANNVGVGPFPSLSTMDLGFTRNAAGVLEVNNGTPGTLAAITASRLQSAAVAFSALPAASSELEGSMRAVTDSSTATWGATITGGGANHVLAYCNGSAWTVFAK